MTVILASSDQIRGRRRVGHRDVSGICVWAPQHLLPIKPLGEGEGFTRIYLLPKYSNLVHPSNGSCARCCRARSQREGVHDGSAKEDPGKGAAPTALKDLIHQCFETSVSRRYPSVSYYAPLARLAVPGSGLVPWRDATFIEPLSRSKSVSRFMRVSELRSGSKSACCLLNGPARRRMDGASEGSRSATAAVVTEQGATEAEFSDSEIAGGTLVYRSS